jgi:hypothetical protein
MIIPAQLEDWDRVADANFAVGDQKCIGSPTNANNAYQCFLMDSQWIADITNGSRYDQR